MLCSKDRGRKASSAQDPALLQSSGKYSLGLGLEGQEDNIAEKAPSIKEKKKNHCQTIKQSTEPDPEISQMLQLPNKEIKILMFNKLNDIVEKVDNMHEYVENVNKEMETIRED